MTKEMKKQAMAAYPQVHALRQKCEYYLTLKNWTTREYVLAKIREARSEMFDIRDKNLRYYGFDPLTRANN